MNKEENVLLKSIAIDLDKDENFEELIQELKSLRTQGYSKTDILVYKNVLDEVRLTGVDESLFNKIKSRQDIPDYVILDFIKCGGSVIEKDFGKRVNDAYGFS